MDRNAKLRRAEARRIAWHNTKSYEIGTALLTVFMICMCFVFMIAFYTLLPIPAITTNDGVFWLLGFSFASVLLSFSSIWPLIIKIENRRNVEVDQLTNELLTKWDEEDKASN